MNFYVYTTNEPHSKGLVDEPLGGDGRTIWKDLKTVQGAVHRAATAFPNKSFKIFKFYNFQDERTFTHVYTHTAR